MSTYNDFCKALREAVNAAWPEVHPNNGGGGIWEEQEAEWAAFIHIGTPYAVIEIPPMGDGDWGLNNVTHEGVVRFHYVMDNPRGSMGVDTLRDKLHSMRHWLLTNDLTTGQVLDCAEPVWGSQHPANKMFIHKGMSTLAGSIGAHCIYGDVIDPEEI